MKISKQELKQKISDSITENDDLVITLLEDIEDSFVEGNEEGMIEKDAYEDLKIKYEDLKAKYKERFLKGEEVKEHDEEKEDDEELKEEEVIDIKEI